MSFNSSRSGAGTSSSVWTSIRATSSSAIARTERVVDFTASRVRGSSGFSLIQQTRASSSRATVGGSSGSASMSPRATSMSSVSRMVTAIGGIAVSSGPSIVSTDSTCVLTPAGRTTTSSPALQTPPAISPP